MPVNDAVKIFRALADPTRLRIMLLLQVRELCVCELTYILKMEQSRVSHQMRILREAGLVEDLRQGRWMIYRIPARSQEFVQDLVTGLRKARVRRAAQLAGDRRKLGVCASGKIRSRSCRPGPAPSRSRTKRKELDG